MAQEGIVVVEIRPATGQGGGRVVSSLRFRRPLVAFTRQMAVMLRNGMRLDAIMRVQLRQSNPKAWQNVLGRVTAELSEGRSLSDALAAQPSIFSKFYVSLVRAGESSGDLAEVFSRLATSLETSDRLRRKVRAALAYPAVITTVAAIVLFILLFYIVPIFKEMFLNFQTELPPLTRAVVGISDLLVDHTGIVMIAVLTGGLGLLLLSRSYALAAALSRLTLHLPGLRTLVLKSETASFSRTIATLLWGGVALNEAIPLASSVVRNVQLRQQFESAATQIASGSTLHQAWSDQQLIPPMVVEMVAVGEETGQLARMFDAIASFYSEEVEALLPTITAVLEPLLIVIVGIFVAAILISMYMPLFELIGQLG